MDVTNSTTFCCSPPPPPQPSQPPPPASDSGNMVGGSGSVRKRRSPSSEETDIPARRTDEPVATTVSISVQSPTANRLPQLQHQQSSQPPPSRDTNTRTTLWNRWKTTNRLSELINLDSLLYRLRSCFWCARKRKSPLQYRTVIPNHLVPSSSSGHQAAVNPNKRYSGNKIKTTKYTLFTFLPKNLFEQFHRFANLYFIFVVLLNWFPQIEAFGKELALIPVLFVLSVTAVKDIFEDRRRYRSDQKINHATCRLYNISEGRYVKTEWKDLMVGDFVHLSCNEIIPADILFVRSSDPTGICYVETSNLDGESNLKQRQMISGPQEVSETFTPLNFKSTIECEQPNNQIYKFNGFLLHHDGQREAINKNNLLLRGCEIRNTDFIEGIVVYAGHETKAMLNNSGPRYKRSKLERLMNWDIVWCVVILLVMCFAGALGDGIWLSSFNDPYSAPYLLYIHGQTLNPELEGFIVFWSYIIILQVMIPISLYVSIEIVKLGQIFFITQDQHLHHRPTNKRIQCRALNIPEELGQIQYVMSDKTGTLTENQMIFRRCVVAGIDYGPTEINSTKQAADFLYTSPSKETGKDVKANAHLQKIMTSICMETMSNGNQSADVVRRRDMFDFFITMAICNTVVVNPHPHTDRMNASGSLTEEAMVTSFSNPYLPNLDTIDEIPDRSMSAPILENGAYRMKSEVAVIEPVPIEDPVIKDNYNHESRNVSVLEMRPLPAINTTSPENEERASDADAELETSTDNNRSVEQSPSPNSDVLKRPSTLAFGKKLLQLPSLAKTLLPPVGGNRKSSNSANTASPSYRNPVYEAESPDELALVYASAAYGFRLAKRHTNTITVDLPHGEYLKYDLLHVLPFDSIRKRMSVIVRHPITKALYLFCKGADTAITEALSHSFCQSQRGQLYICKSQEFLNLYASFGLRTLSFAKRELTLEEYNQWAVQHAEAEMALDDREELILESALKIETGLELLGATGIEDRLQEGVAECISSLRQGGIKVWVLTGDKIETAVNIAYACKLFCYGMELIQLCARNESDTDTLLQHHLDQMTRRNLENGESQKSTIENLGLVVDGQTLAYCLTPKMEAKFVLLISRCTSVLCCRATPLQKASVVRLVKEKLEAVTLAIGDGANDVSMIQCADVGVGLSGQEGMQAVMASDFAMAQFRFLGRLLLVHGHWCYDRLTRMVLYFFYKNAMFVFTLFWYQFFNGFSAQVMIDPLYLLLHNLVFTSLPPLLMGVFDQDTSAYLLIEHRSLYKQGADGSLYKSYSFWLHIIDALWQSLVCFFVPYFLYVDTNTPMWTLGFLVASALVLCNQAHLLVELHTWTVPLVSSVVLSIAVFYGFALSYNALSLACCAPDAPLWVAERSVNDITYWLALILILILALWPRVSCRVIANTMFPSPVLVANTRDRLKRKKCASQSCPSWFAKFAKKTKTVSFIKAPRQTSSVAPVDASVGEQTNEI